MKNVNRDFAKMLEDGFFNEEEHKNIQLLSEEEHDELHSFDMLHSVTRGRIRCVGEDDGYECPFCEAEKAKAEREKKND